MKSILEDLNEAQRAAVEHTEGPSMVIAGAGSGKTRVLTYRVAHLLNLGKDPFNILALTFTNKAAREMKERIYQLVGSADAKNVWMGTFHSIFARVLRIEGHRLGYYHDFTIYDYDDSKNALKKIIQEQELDIKLYAPSMVLNRISAAKSNLVSAREYNDNEEIQLSDKMAGKPHIGRIYSLYQTKLFRSSAMDFDDLLFNMFILLRDFADVLYKYQNKFMYILVDEYQDTNHAQYAILKKLAANNENICVVGDDAQSIYAFRGANIQNILNFRHDYPDMKTFKLEQNYRSTQTIVKAANSIIVNNKDQIFKEIWTKNEEGSKIFLLKAASDNEEGTLIANSIFENKMNFQLRNDAFAVLYRTNAQSRAIEEALRRLNIPYRIFGGLSFYGRKEVKDLLAYFRLVVNPRDEEALLRVINYPARGIGKTTVEKIQVVAGEQGLSPWEIIQQPEHFDPGINMGSLQKIRDFVTMIKSFGVMLKTRNAFDLAKHIASSSGLLKDLYEDKTPEGVSRFENIEELLNAIKDFSMREKEAREIDGQELEANAMRTLDEFLQEVSLLTDADSQDKENTDRVALMTIHMAKGLEFPFVYIAGLEENLFPSIQSLGSRADLEEERRLFYVALTRAGKRVTLSYAENRYRWGDLIFCEPSRFIDEINPTFIERPKKSSLYGEERGFHLPGREKRSSSAEESPSPGKKFRKVLPARPGFGQLEDPSFNADLEAVQAGMQVEHQKFGTGKVISIEGTGSSKKATVFFPEIGQKQLLLKFARLKILNQ